MTLPIALEPTVAVDWNNDGTYTGTYDDVTNAVAGDPGVSVDTGKDGGRSLNPPKVPAFEWELYNHDGAYSQERPSSPVYQLVLPGRPARVTARHGEQRLYRSHVTYRDAVPYRGRAIHYLATGKLEDISQEAALGNQRVRLSSLGATAALVSRRVSVAVQASIRTDQALALLLDAAGWPADKRDLAVGDTILLWWWCDERSPWEAMLELLASEGPGSIWEDGDGVLHFENRNYRTAAARSSTSQATFFDRSVSGRTTYRDHVVYRGNRLYRGRSAGLYFTDLKYEPGFRSLYNRATFPTRRRELGPVEPIWEYGATLVLTANQSRTLIVRPSDPFREAVAPAAGVDYSVSLGTATVTLAATSGLVAFITVTAGAGGATIVGVTSTGLQLRARSLRVVSETTVQSSVDTSASIAKFGERTLQLAGWPEIDPNYAVAACDSWVLRYQVPRPQVTIIIRNADGDHLRQILTRRVSDRITLRETNTGLNADVWVESKALRISGASGRAVEAVLGCEVAADVAGAIWDISLWDTGVWGV